LLPTSEMFKSTNHVYGSWTRLAYNSGEIFWDDRSVPWSLNRANFRHFKLWRVPPQSLRHSKKEEPVHQFWLSTNCIQPDVSQDRKWSFFPIPLGISLALANRWWVSSLKKRSRGAIIHYSHICGHSNTVELWEQWR
jgi:hypothetical protein